MIYWEESLSFDLDEILAVNKRHTFADKESTSKILRKGRSQEDDKENSGLAAPPMNRLQKQVSFQVKSQQQKFAELKDEFIYFNIYEHYDQGEEIFLCGTKISVGQIMKRTNRFLFNLLVKDKKLGQLKIGKPDQSSTTAFSNAGGPRRSTSPSIAPR